MSNDFRKNRRGLRGIRSGSVAYGAAGAGSPPVDAKALEFLARVRAITDAAGDQASAADINAHVVEGLAEAEVHARAIEAEQLKAAAEQAAAQRAAAERMAAATVWVSEPRHVAAAGGGGRGKRINPVSVRVGVNRTWDSRWFADGPEYGKLLHEDIKVRRALKKRLRHAGVSRIIIERPHKTCRITIYAARPGVIIGKKGADIDKLRKDIAAMTDGEVHLNIVEIRRPETDAQLVAETIAQQLERRVAFRRAMKRSMQSAKWLGAKGVRINVSGRLGGAEIARMEWHRDGRVPLHTLRADVDYGFTEAKTISGIIGVKVWIFKGDVVDRRLTRDEQQPASPADEPRQSPNLRSEEAPEKAEHAALGWWRGPPI